MSCKIRIVVFHGAILHMIFYLHKDIQLQRLVISNTFCLTQYEYVIFTVSFMNIALERAER